MPVTDVSNMKVADLKRELKVRGLPITGNKNELQERLQAAMEGEPLLEDSSLVGEDILDEEEGVLSDEEKILGADENELLKSPTSTPTTILPKTLGSENKDAAALEDDILESPTTTTKKIILKRKSSFNSGGTTLETNASTTKENTEPSPAKAVKMSERNPITMGEDKKLDNEQAGVTKKVKELTMQERLELRAKKFGLETKTPTITAKEKNAAISVAPVVSSEKQVELLKKRAERFGCVTSTNLAKLDAEERLLKRKQRFGGEVDSATKAKVAENNTITTTGTATSNENDEWAEKARKRLERFKGSSTTPTESAAAVVTASATPAPAAAATST
ncbi:myocardin-related transcription factor B [Lucilia sericata]|uniref:myocardin-related transcription factor B n=1 Tax=Lucilia sericata TaxID=13632 RepID=UPI0018A834CD|nr:myocardin-related transcription factor B [Lucilia sericata]